MAVTLPSLDTFGLIHKFFLEPRAICLTTDVSPDSCAAFSHDDAGSLTRRTSWTNWVICEWVLEQKKTLNSSVGASCSFSTDGFNVKPSLEDLSVVCRGTFPNAV